MTTPFKFTPASRAKFEQFVDVVGRTCNAARALGEPEDTIRNGVAALIATCCGNLTGKDLEWALKQLQDAAGVPRPMPRVEHQAPRVLQ